MAYTPISPGESTVLHNIMEVLGYKDDTSSYYAFDVTKVAGTARASIRVGLKVFVPKGQNRETVSNQIRDKLDKKFGYELKDAKNDNQLNVIIPNGTGNKIIRLDIKPVSNPRGARETAIGESAQCVYCRLRFTRTKDLVEPISEDDLREAYNSPNVHVDAKIEDILALGEEWKESCILGANELMKEHGKKWKGTPNKMTFYRKVGLDAEIAKAFKKIKKNLEKQGEEDKWNPADIWMASGKVGAKEIEAAAKSQWPLNLNANLISWYLGGDLVGISLKKMKKNAHVTQVNLIGGKSRRVLMNDQGQFNKTSSNWVKLTPTAAGGGFKYGPGSDQEVQLRNFGGGRSANFQGEAKGVGAMGGKISPSVMEGLIKSPGFNPKFNFPNNQTIWNQAGGNKKDQSKLAKFISAGLKDFGIDLSADDIMEKRWAKKPEDKTPMALKKYLYSKYMTLVILKGIEGITPADKRQECIVDIFLYSNSQWKDSGFHLKLSD